MERTAIRIGTVILAMSFISGCRSVPENVTITPIVKMKKAQSPNALELIRDNGKRTTYQELSKQAQDTLARFCIYGVTMYACYDTSIADCVMAVNRELEKVSKSTDYNIVVEQKGKSRATLFIHEETPLINLCRDLALSAGQFLWLSDEGRLYMFFYSPEYGYDKPGGLGEGTYVKFTQEQLP